MLQKKQEHSVKIPILSPWTMCHVIYLDQLVDSLYGIQLMKIIQVITSSGSSVSSFFDYSSFLCRIYKDSLILSENRCDFAWWLSPHRDLCWRCLQQYAIVYIFLSPAIEIWVKVMFLHLSVRHSLHRGVPSLAGGSILSKGTVLRRGCCP